MKKTFKNKCANNKTNQSTKQLSCAKTKLIRNTIPFL